MLLNWLNLSCLTVLYLPWIFRRIYWSRGLPIEVALSQGNHKCPGGAGYSAADQHARGISSKVSHFWEVKARHTHTALPAAQAQLWHSSAETGRKDAFKETQYISLVDLA